jgi:hypothetical protein
MTRKLLGLCAAFTLVTSGVALANEGNKQQGTGGSAQEGTQQPSTPSKMDQQHEQMQQGMSQTGSTELQGEVARVESKTIYVKHMGAVVPLKIDKDTKLDGKTFSKRDLKEGQEIRASFTVENGINNVADTISTSDLGTGGAGMQQQQPSTIPDDSTNLPSEPERTPQPEDTGTSTTPPGGTNY